jgi:hypothetical protein
MLTRWTRLNRSRLFAPFRIAVARNDPSSARQLRRLTSIRAIPACDDLAGQGDSIAMKRSLTLTCTIVATLVASVRSEEPPPKPSASRELMARKLAHAQGVLSALATEDYGKMSENAEELLKLAEKQWIAVDTPEYRSHLKDFWIVADGIRSSAAEKNVDGATLAYVQMTISCVKCHKYLRGRSE